MMPMSLIDIDILNIRGSNYRCIISGTRKSEDIILMQNIHLTKKSGTL